MARKPIPDAVQNAILLKSRRRCCLCFWLEGRDEVSKGQIAHLDQNNENNAEDNLCFLCLDHHDQYDGTTRLAKGLKESEVRSWRDQLYKEMEYRFRTIKVHRLQASVVFPVWFGEPDQFTVVLCMKNTGEVDAVSPLLSLQLPERVVAERPTPRERDFPPALPPMFGMRLKLNDLFGEYGRVGVKDFHNGFVLHPDHSVEFVGLTLRLADFPLSSVTEMGYRIDCRDAVPSKGQITIVAPADMKGFLPWKQLPNSFKNM